ncbi:MAG: hypothetical protein IKN67_03000 [Alphaproteobacteria bacterium]|nr:hypothetical protein [Alphaproteobacteria bacterium]
MKKLYITLMLIFQMETAHIVYAACADPQCNSCETSENICDKCKDGYILGDNGICYQISKFLPNCESAVVSKGTWKICTKCEDGYVIVAGNCVKGENCPEGYYTKSGINYCIPDECQGIQKHYCQTCKTGTYSLKGECVTDCGDGMREEGNVYNGTINRYCVTAESTGDNANYGVYGHSAHCSSGYVLNNGLCIREEDCKNGYIIANTSLGYPSCVKETDGCGYMQKPENGKCVERKEDENCGEGFLLKNGLCIAEYMGCGNEFKYDDIYKECNRIRYTLQEADNITSDDNENYIEWIFE